MFNLSSLKFSGIGAACLVAFGVSAHADNTNRVHNQDTYPVQGTGGTKFNWYVDFASTTSGTHFSEPTGTFGGTAGLKYHVTQLATYGNGDAACFELSTQAANAVPSTVVDTRIWFPSPTDGSMVSLNDDVNGTYFSKARFWMAGQDASVNVSIASFSTSAANNTGHFEIVITRLNISEADCTTNQATIAWFKKKPIGGGSYSTTWQVRNN
jgi:hypothetical protein